MENAVIKPSMFTHFSVVDIMPVCEYNSKLDMKKKTKNKTESIYLLLGVLWLNLPMSESCRLLVFRINPQSAFLWVPCLSLGNRCCKGRLDWLTVRPKTRDTLPWVENLQTLAQKEDGSSPRQQQSKYDRQETSLLFLLLILFFSLFTFSFSSFFFSIFLFLFSFILSLSLSCLHFSFPISFCPFLPFLFFFFCFFDILPLSLLFFITSFLTSLFFLCLPTSFSLLFSCF